MNVKTSGASNIVFAVRNIGNGRFGEPMGAVFETGLSAIGAGAVGGATPHDSVDSGNPIKVGGYAKTAAPTSVADGDRVNAWFSQRGALNVENPTAAISKPEKKKLKPLILSESLKEPGRVGENPASNHKA